MADTQIQEGDQGECFLAHLLWAHVALGACHLAPSARIRARLGR
jgi:hypothetical protein